MDQHFFEVGHFWGEQQFLRMAGKTQRTMTVAAVTFCEVASLDPDDIDDMLLEFPSLRKRLHAYGAMRAKIEDKIASGVAFDMTELTKELEERYFNSGDGDEEEVAGIQARKIKAVSNGQLAFALDKLTQKLELEIAVVNYRMSMIESHLERAVTQDEARAEQHVAAVHEACQNLGEQLLEHYDKPKKRGKGIPLTMIPGIA